MHKQHLQTVLSRAARDKRPEPFVALCGPLRPFVAICGHLWGRPKECTPQQLASYGACRSQLICIRDRNGAFSPAHPCRHPSRWQLVRQLTTPEKGNVGDSSNALAPPSGEIRNNDIFAEVKLLFVEKLACRKAGRGIEYNTPPVKILKARHHTKYQAGLKNRRLAQNAVLIWSALGDEALNSVALNQAVRAGVVSMQSYSITLRARSLHAP